MEKELIILYLLFIPSSQDSYSEWFLVLRKHSPVWDNSFLWSLSRSADAVSSWFSRWWISLITWCCTSNEINLKSSCYDSHEKTFRFSYKSSQSNRSPHEKRPITHRISRRSKNWLGRLKALYVSSLRCVPKLPTSWDVWQFKQRKMDESISFSQLSLIERVN